MRSVPSILLILLLLIVAPLPVRGQYAFGRNKIQYNRFQWHILETEHFDIYFYPEMEELAKIGAGFAEEGYRMLQDRLNHSIVRRIPLIFYSTHFHFEETNIFPFQIPQGVAGVFEYMKGRVIVPSDGNLAQFKGTIWHELVHVFQASIVQRALKDRRILKYRDLPLWFKEGLADEWGEGWDSTAEMVMRDVVLNHTVVPIERLHQIYGTFLLYKEGQSIVRFIAERYGEESLRRMMLDVYKEENFSDVMRFVIGKDYAALNEEWMYSLKQEYYPLMASHESPGMAMLHVTEDGFNVQPAVFREGDTPKVVFVGNRNGYAGIYMKGLRTEEEEKPELLIQGERTPDLESLRLQQSGIDVDERGRLAFVVKSGPQDVLTLYDIPGRRTLERYTFDDVVTLFSPAWSPDGARIAVAGLDRGGRCDLYVVTVTDGSLTRLTHDFYDDRDPAWSPDGSMLVFGSNRSDWGREGYSNLFSYDFRTSRISYLTFGPHQDAQPSFSPCGRYLTFSSDRDGVSNVWAIEAGKRPGSGDRAYSLYERVPGTGGTVMKQVTHFLTGAFSPVWTDSALVVGAFERMSFQIRALEDVHEILDTSPAVEANPLQKAEDVWTYHGIGGQVGERRARYKKKFSLDVAQSQIVHDPIFGMSGGGQLSISDMLGDEQYYVLVYNNARTRSEFWDGFNFAVSRLDLKRRVHYSLGLYRLSGYYYNRYEGYFYENRTGGFGAVSYPLNAFERLETSINVRNSVKDVFDGTGERRAFLLSNFVSYVRDNSLWGPTGPLDGCRVNLTLGNTVDIVHSNVNFTTAMVDIRKYFRLSRRMAHAVRLWGQFNHGQEALPFVMGGSWDLRGYKTWSLWGTKLFLVSNELRFPFIDQLYLGFPFGGLGFSSIRGALFVDAGNVWDDAFGEWMGSFGFGVRMRLGGFLVLRLDVGRKTDFKTVETHTFTQFFFGWDF